MEVFSHQEKSAKATNSCFFLSEEPPVWYLSAHHGLSTFIQFYTKVAAFGGDVNHISITMIPKVIDSPVLIAGALPAAGRLGDWETQEPRYLGLAAILQFPPLHTLSGEGRTKSPRPPRRFWLINLHPTPKLTSSKLPLVKFIQTES